MLHALRELTAKHLTHGFALGLSKIYKCKKSRRTVTLPLSLFWGSEVVSMMREYPRHTFFFQLQCSFSFKAPIILRIDVQEASCLEQDAHFRDSIV